MSILAYRAVTKEIDRLEDIKKSNSAQGIKDEIKELKERLKNEKHETIKNLLQREIDKLQKSLDSAEMPDYVDPVLKHLKAAHDEMKKHKDYTSGLRRGK